MNEVLTGRRIKERVVSQQTGASMCVKSESVSNEIDESDVQFEEHSEQRI
jgi:hypothetical protein